MIRIATALALMVAVSDAQACSGMVKQDVEGTQVFETVHEGDVLLGLNQALRDTVTGSMVVCGQKCYPAIGRFDSDDGPMTEIVELHGCKVGKMISDEADIETYDLEDEKKADRRKRDH